MTIVPRTTECQTSRTSTGTKLVSGVAPISKALGDEHPQLVRAALVIGAIPCIWTAAGKPVVTLQVVEETKRRIAACRSTPEPMPGAPSSPKSSMEWAA